MIDKIIVQVYTQIRDLIWEQVENRVWFKNANKIENQVWLCINRQIGNLISVQTLKELQEFCDD